MIHTPSSSTFRETKGKTHALVSTSGQDSTTTFHIQLLCKFLFMSHKSPSITFYLHPEQPKWPTQWFPCSPPLPLHSRNSLNLEYPTILTRRTAGSYGKIMLHCFRKCQTVFQRGCTIVHSHHNVVEFQSLHILTFCCLFLFLLKQVWRGISLWFRFSFL